MSAGLNRKDFTNFVAYVKRLEQMAKPSNSDIRFGQYLQYFNCAVRKFVDDKAYLVGSTAEQTKLSFSKDDGDADFLFVSGKLQIPVENLELNVHNRCYVWLQADAYCKSLGLEIVDGCYLSACSLREVRPELFTMLRAIHSVMTISFDKLPDAGRKDTQVTVPSKVGLASTKYEDLKWYGNHAQYDRQYCPKDFLHRSEKTKDALIKRWETVQVQETDTKMLRRALKVLKSAKHPGGRGQNNGQLSFAVQALDDAISRPKPTFSNIILHCKQNTHANESYEEIGKNVSYENDLNEDDDVKNDMESMRVTYKCKHHIDFVPALKIKGDTGYLKEWKRRVKAAGWEDSRINDIYSADLFVVSRLAPVNPNIGKDFCLSFNLAELKLVKSMTNVQRRVFLLLKCFLKGIFDEKHKKEGIEMKLKTYHVKTLLFWLYEAYNNAAEVDDFETVYFLLQTALRFLRSKLVEKELLHYFLPDNLFIEFDEEDFRILIECVDTVRCNITKSIKSFFDLDVNKPTEMSVSPEEMRTIMEMMEDGGRRQLIDKLEDAVIDMFRGFNESQRDELGRAPIKEAIIDTFKLFLDDEKQIDLQIFKQINNFLTGGVTDINETNLVEVNKRINDLFVLIEGLGMFQPKIKDFMDIFGGRPCLQELLQGALIGKPVDLDKDLREQIIETIDRYMSCCDEDEDKIAAELKYKLLGYFSGLEEFPHLSNLRI